MPDHRERLAGVVFVPPVSPWRVWLCAIFSGVLAALIGWVAGERANRSIHWEGRIQVGQGNGGNQPAAAELLRELRSKAEAKNTALAMSKGNAGLGGRSTEL